MEFGQPVLPNERAVLFLLYCLTARFHLDTYTKSEKICRLVSSFHLVINITGNHLVFAVNWGCPPHNLGGYFARIIYGQQRDIRIYEELVTRIRF